LEGENQVNLWIKRAIGVAALGGGLLALGAGSASAQEVSADASARVGRPTSAEVRVCADGRVLSRLLGSCGQASSGGTSASVRAGRGSGSSGIRVRARVPRVAAADVSVGARRSRPAAGASGQASATRPGRADADVAADSSPRADAAASLSRPRAGRLLNLRPVTSLAGVGLLGSSPFTLAGDPASGNLLPTGELTLDGPTGEAPAGIGVLESGPIASGNQVAVDAGDVSPSVPVTVCGNGAGVLGDVAASCGTAQPAGSGSSTGSTGSENGSDDGSTGAEISTGPAGAGTSTSDTLLDDAASGNQVDAGIGSISPAVPVLVCGNGVGALGDSSASCGTALQAAGDGTTRPSGDGGSAPTGEPGDGTAVSADGVTASVPVTACGNGVGPLGDASAGCGSDTSTGGIIAPTPDTPGGTDTGTSGIPGGSTGTSGLLATTGLTPGISDAAGDPVASFAPLPPLADGSGALPFTGAASDLLAVAGAGLLAAGFLVVRATRPDTAGKGGGDR
jgi:hypothetical protein